MLKYNGVINLKKDWKINWKKKRKEVVNEVDGNKRKVKVNEEIVEGKIMVGNIMVKKIGWKKLINK